MDEKQINELWIKGMKVNEIASVLGVNSSSLKNKITRLRKKDPRKWPRRNCYPTKLKRLFHVYECEDCAVVFAVEQAYEDQSEVCCPICWDDAALEDIGSGEM